MKLITNPIDRIATMLLGDLGPTGIILSRIAFGFTMVAAMMSYGFGKEMHWIHGLGLAFLTFITAIAPDAVYHMYERGKWAVAIAVAIVAIPMFVMEFSSHAGYAAGFRGASMSEAKVSQVKWDGAQEATAEDKTNLEMWKKQLADLTTQNAWAATVKAEALREQVANAEAYIKMEAARGGCKQKCEARMRERDALVTKIGTIEQAEDLTKRIEATQRILDKKRDVAAKTEHKVSPISFQNKFFARVAALTTEGSLKVSDTMEEGSEQGLAIGLAYVFTMGPAIAWLLAGMYRINPRGAMQFASSIGHAASSAASGAAQKLNSAAGVTQNFNVNDIFGKYQTALMAEREALRSMGRAANA